jgi:hypothetical protein
VGKLTYIDLHSITQYMVCLRGSAAIYLWHFFNGTEPPTQKKRRQESFTDKCARMATLKMKILWGTAHDLPFA